MKVTKKAIELAVRTADAYSADRYNSWPMVAQTLLGMGFGEPEAEAIMRSKWTRWAADRADVCNKAAAHHVKTFIMTSFPDKPKRDEEVKRMVLESGLKPSTTTPLTEYLRKAQFHLDRAAESAMGLRPYPIEMGERLMAMSREIERIIEAEVADYFARNPDATR